MEKILERVSGILKKQGVEDFDIYAVESRGVGIEVKEGRVDKLKNYDKRGVAVRVVVEGRMGFAFTTDVSEDGIKVAIECARENSKNVAPDEHYFSLPSKGEVLFSLADESFNSIPLSRKIEIAKILELKAKEHDSRVRKVRKSAYGDSFSTVYYVNSNGHFFTYSTTSFSLSILLAATSGEESQIGWDFETVRYFADLNPDKVAVEAAQSAVELLGAKPMKTRKLPVIFKNKVFGEVIEALSPMFLGDNVLKGKSLFADKLGYEVSSRTFSIYDDPTLREGTGSVPFDDEGFPTKRKVVIDRGVLKNFLLDSYSAKKLGMAPTGNGIRASISSPPSSGITNLVVERGALGFNELVKTPEEVLVVTDAMGIHTINPISGEFSIGISGIYYKDGNPVSPVTGMTVAGNVKELLFGITQVGSDSKWLGNVCAPSVLVKSLTVSGV